MNLNITKDQPDPQTNGDIAINSREVETTVTVNDGETVVLGGVFERDYSENVSKVPFLADLPGIGFLFTKKSKADDKRELLIFVTPKVVRDGVMPK